MSAPAALSCVVCRHAAEACRCPRSDDERDDYLVEVLPPGSEDDRARDAALLADVLGWMTGDALPMLPGVPGGGRAHAAGLRLVERIRAAGYVPSAGTVRRAS